MQGNVLCWGKFLAVLSRNDRAGKAPGPETLNSKGVGEKKNPPLFLFLSCFLFNIVFPLDPPSPSIYGQPILTSAKPSGHNQGLHPKATPIFPADAISGGGFKPKFFLPSVLGFGFFCFFGFFWVFFLQGRIVPMPITPPLLPFWGAHATGCCEAEGNRDRPRWGRVVAMYLNHSQGYLA